MQTLNKTYRNVGLIIMMGIIVGSTVYLEAKKVRTNNSADVANATIDLSTIGAGTSTTGGTPPRTPDFASREMQYPAAKELVKPDGYINTDNLPITIKSLIGKKVILVDFWTYSCINCQRTIPYLNAWYSKYKDAGLEIIGVHSPEFQFEKNIINVQSAVNRFGIQYPVVMDSQMQTWNAYENQYWPEEYLIDINGLVVERHIGEGGYGDTEAKIQQLLTERKLATKDTVTISTGTVSIVQTISTNSPETYFGMNRNEYLANGVPHQLGLQTLSRPVDASIEPNQLYLSGGWNFKDEYAENQTSDAHIVYKYQSKNVYFVASSVTGASITVLRDGVVVGSQKGEDVDSEGHVMIREARLYKLIQESTPGEHTLEIIIKNPGLDAYTFTFG